MKKVITQFLILVVLLASTTSTSLAQTNQDLQLTVTRDWGYGGFGGDVQGLLSFRIKNPPANLASVDFYIDSTLVGTATSKPFNYQFNTDSYPNGPHTLSAVGHTTDGSELKSNSVQRQFVVAGNAGPSILKFVLPILGVVILAALVAVFLPLVLNRGKLADMPLGTERKYGIGGGAICPKCNRPFPLRLWWINLGVKKIDRCPYCGKWSMVRPRSVPELRAAEEAELKQGQPEAAVTGESEADKLRRELDESRYNEP